MSDNLEREPNDSTYDIHDVIKTYGQGGRVLQVDEVHYAEGPVYRAVRRCGDFLVTQVVRKLHLSDDELPSPHKQWMAGAIAAPTGSDIAWQVELTGGATRGRNGLHPSILGARFTPEEVLLDPQINPETFTASVRETPES